MNAIVTMARFQNSAIKYRTFQIRPDGSAIADRMLQIIDFPAYFIYMVKDRGWQMVSEREVEVARNNDLPKPTFAQEQPVYTKNEYRQEWYSLMDNLVDNYDRG